MTKKCNLPHEHDVGTKLECTGYYIEGNPTIHLIPMNLGLLTILGVIFLYTFAAIGIWECVKVLF